MPASRRRLRRPQLRPVSSERGSVLLVALLLAAVIGLALASYLRLSNTSLKVSQRAFLQNSAMNLAEMGVEKALATFNRASSGDATAWDGWTVSGTDATRTLEGFTPAPGATGVIKVYVRNYTSATSYSSAVSSSSSSSSSESSDDHSEDDHAESDHTESDHTEDDHSEDDHAEDDHAEDDHSSDDHSSDDHGSGDFAQVAGALARVAADFRPAPLAALTRRAAMPALLSLAGGLQPRAQFDLPLGFLGTLAGGADDHSEDDHSSDDHSDDDHSDDDHSEDDHSESDHSADDTPSEDVDVPAASTSATVTSNSIVIVAKAIVTPADGSGELVKVLEVTLRRRSLWGFGLVGRSWVHLNSQASADSWNSDPDGDGSGIIAYSSGVRADHGTVGCVSSANGAISLNSNAEIYGSAQSGGGSVTTTSNVRIHNASSPSDPKVDPACVRTDFSFTFPAITVPSPTVTNAISSTITSSRTFPQTGDNANPADGKYYYQFGSGAAIDMDSNKNLTIAGNVVWLFQSHTGVTSIRTSSNADTLFSGDTSTLEIYTNGNISLDSNNDINASGQPQRCQIWGTASTSQTFTLSSNVNLGAVIYAPNAAFQIDSNCVLLGSVVGDTIQMDSNSRFHYDEALGNYGGSNPFRVSSWRELRTAEERATYADELNF